MKKIDIIGKRNQDRMKQKIDPNATIEKKTIKNNKIIDDKYYNDQSLGLNLLKEYNPEIITTKKSRQRTTKMIRCNILFERLKIKEKLIFIKINYILYMMIAIRYLSNKL